jgi:hypothetical protein
MLTFLLISPPACVIPSNVKSDGASLPPFTLAGPADGGDFFGGGVIRRPPADLPRGSHHDQDSPLSIAAPRDDQTDRVLEIENLHRENRDLRAELVQAEPLISAAVLAATAFRLRDREALTEGLRLLVQATQVWEDERAST